MRYELCSLAHEVQSGEWVPGLPPPAAQDPQRKLYPAVVITARDDHDNAFIQLEEAIRARDNGVATLHLKPLFDPLEGGPPLRPVIQRKIRSSTRD